MSYFVFLILDCGCQGVSEWKKVSGLDVIWVFTSHNIHHFMPSVEVGRSSWRHILPSHFIEETQQHVGSPKSWINSKVSWITEYLPGGSALTEWFFNAIWRRVIQTHSK
ncbi:uncharacterized protein LOC124202640 [Daphnia pulex]|uniref:uncharacterized protein LOC124202640 n=1 Tax=Daphnia pulex TaxID=6669 RepID=UPI001EDDEB61|nr:uncharacterized protein LOC124202640 [Daphnia pulex]